MKLEQIGFYTLSNRRAERAGAHSPMWRGEMILTDKCNFKCPFCRGLSQHRGDLPINQARKTLALWIAEGLKNVRFSGGEPTLHEYLGDLVQFCREGGVERIAISTNGSQPFWLYENLVHLGVNDISISLDACCAATGDQMAGIRGKFGIVTENIKQLSKLTYVTVGVVITWPNLNQVADIVQYAHSLGVADIRLISAAQFDQLLPNLENVPFSVLKAHPILRYRLDNLSKGRHVRGLRPSDCNQCHLVQDDSVVAGDKHYPCVIYLRENGAPIGTVGETMRRDRVRWSQTHDTHKDPICKKNCLDVCIDYNNCYERSHRVGHPLRKTACA